MAKLITELKKFGYSNGKTLR